MNLRALVNTSLAVMDRLLGRQEPLIVILCYHSFNNDDWFYGVSPNVLDQQLAFLSKSRNFITIEQLLAHVEGKKTITEPSALVTIDDGYQNISSVVSIFAKHNVRPVVFITAKPDQVKRDQLQNEYPLMSWKACRELLKKGWSFGSHTATHPNLNTDGTDLVSEIVDSKSSIERELGQTCDWIAYPKGEFNEEVLSVVTKAGYRLGFATDVASFVPAATNRLTIARVGINRTHALNEFQDLFTPSAYVLRALVATITSKINEYAKN